MSSYSKHHGMLTPHRKCRNIVLKCRNIALSLSVLLFLAHQQLIKPEKLEKHFFISNSQSSTKLKLNIIFQAIDFNVSPSLLLFQVS
jgi:hypothetical protein